MSEILAIIGKPSFCAFPELVQGLKDNQLVDGVIAKELLDKVKSSESMGYNIMVAVASIYDRLQKIYDENCTSVNKNTLLEIAKELIWFGDALKYIPSDTANHIVRLREGGFTFGETNFLLQYVTDSKMIEKLIKQTNFNNRVLEPLIILNRNYLSSSLYSCTRSIIISTLAEKNEDGCLDVELGGRLLRVLPERFIPLILQKIDLKTNFQKITKILMNRFKNNWVSDNTESWEQRIYHNYQMVTLLAEAANGQTMSSELEGFLFTRIDDTQLEYIHKNFVCSKEKLSPEAKNDSESKLTKSNFIYKVGRDVIPNGYKELLLKKLKTLQEVSKKRTFGFAHESLVAMLLDYIQEQDKRPFTLEEFTIFGIFLQSFSQDSRKNNLEQKLIEMYQQREIDLSNNSKTEASASATSKEFLENILKTAVEENNDSEWEYHYSNEIFGDSSSFSSPGRDSSSSSSSSISSPCFSSSSISSPRFSSSSRRQYRFSSPGRDSSSSSSSSSVSQEGTSSNLKVKNTQILVGEEYKSQPTGDLAISAALIDLNIENANTAWDSEVFGVSTTWENLPKIYGNKKRRAYYEPDSDDDSDSDGDGGYNNYCDEPRCSSPDPDWIMKTKGISPPPSGFSNNTLTRGAYSQRTAFPSCMNFGNPPYYGDDDNEDYDSRRRNYFPRDSVTPSPRRRQGRPSSPPPRSNLSLSESDISNFPWLKALERTLIDESNYLPPIDEDGELSPKILRIKGEKNLVRVEEEPIYSINTTKQYEIMGVPFYISSNGKARNFGRDVRCQVEGLPEEKRAEETLTIAYSKYFRPLENIYAKTAKESESCSLTKFVWGPDNIDVLLLINGERDYLRNCIGNEGKSGKSVSSSSDSSSSETNNESSSSNFSTTNFSTTIVTSISSGSSQTSAAPKRKHEKGPYDKMLLKPVHGYVKFQLNNKMKKSKEDEEYEEYEE
jgi:hypothetical protein